MPYSIIPQGFKDDVTKHVATEHRFKNLIVELFQLSGFQLIKTPLIEFESEKNNNNIFKISVPKNEKKLVIRDDITMQVARLSQTRMFNKNRPLKLCYYGEVVRKKGTMLRPERQFLQIGAECIGEKSYLADVEMMNLASSALNLVGVKDITIEISSRVFFDKLISKIKLNQNINEIKRLIKIKDLNSLLALLDKKNKKFVKDIFSCTGIYKEKKSNLEKLRIDQDTINEIDNIKNIKYDFIKINKKFNIFLDLCEIDDKNYHSGVRFTFFAHNVRGEIARGGRYSVNILNSKDDATGFTCYMDTILRASSYKKLKKKIMISFHTKESKIKDLIKKGYIVTKNFSKFNKDLKIKAKDQNCEFYLINNIIKKV